MNNKRFVKNFFSLDNIYTIVSIIYVGMIFFYIDTFFVDRPKFGILFFGGSLIIFALRVLRGDYQSLKKLLANKKIKMIVTIILICLAITITIWFWKEYTWLIYERAGNANRVDIIFGGIALLLTILSVYVYSGPAIVVVVLLFILYGFFGRYFPGFLRFSGFSLCRIIDICAVQIYRGIFGDLLQLGGTLVAIFIIFAGFAKSLGGFDVIVKVSFIIAKISKYLVAESAVFASAVMGMFSGSGAANVAGTGSFTIPLMKKYKIPAHFAAAVEAVASAGGQIMPPIMGAAAFLMAEYLGIPYIRIAIMATLPALLYFLGVGFSVYYISRTVKIEAPINVQNSRKTERRHKLVGLFIDSIPLLISLISLILLMVVVQIDALIAGYYSCIIIIGVSFVKGFILNKESIKLYFKKFGEMLLRGAKNSAGTIMEIGLMLGAIEIIVVMLSTSGLSAKLGFLLMSMGQDQIIYILILAAIICIILGCVVSTVAVYILAMVVVVPALVRVGINPIVANFYVFWFAILGLISPPVAGNVVAACRIADSPFMKTAMEAIKIGIGLVVIPVVMIVHPEILLYNAKTPITFIMTLITLYTLSIAFYGGYLLPGGKGLVIRIICAVLSLLALLAPMYNFISYIINGGLLVFFIILNRKERQKKSYR